MKQPDDMTERPSRDLFYFGLACAGLIVAGAGVVIPSAGVAILGALLFAPGLAYFLLHT